MRQKIDVKIYEKVKDEVIRDYQNKVKIKDIFKQYNISQRNLYKCLGLWGVARRRRKGVSCGVRKYHRPQPEPKMEVSKELLARREVNTAINNKKIKYIKMVNIIEDRRLIHNIINHPIMGWRR